MIVWNGYFVTVNLGQYHQLDGLNWVADSDKLSQNSDMLKYLLTNVYIGDAQWAVDRKMISTRKAQNALHRVSGTSLQNFKMLIEIGNANPNIFDGY